MTVMSVSDVYSQAETQSKTDNNVMGKDDFLTLLVAQLQNQDPLNPSDSTEFTAQLAQFSSLEQLQNINDSLAGFEVYQSTSNNIQASGFIGKTITASGSSFMFDAASAEPLHFELSDDAASVYIKIYDSLGNFVGDIDAGALSSGEHRIDWDGVDTNGQTVADGRYSFSVMATDADGSVVGSTGYTTGVVTGIDYKTGNTQLLIDDYEVPIASVVRVADAGQAEE